MSGGLWSDGVVYSTRRTVAPTSLMVTDPVYLRDKVLRYGGEEYQDEDIEQMLAAAVELCEAFPLPGRPQRVVAPATFEMRLSRFPCRGVIELEKAPVISVLSVDYYDGDGVARSLAGSPAEYQFLPHGQYEPARILPLPLETFPTTQTRPDAVTITYRAGYTTVPPMVLRGVLLIVGELDKQRSLSVHAVHNTPSLLQAESFWRGPY